MKPVFVFLFVIVFIACQQKPKVLSIDEMKVVMLDMITIDEWTKINATKDSSILKSKQNTSLYSQVFRLHNIKKEDFYTSYSFYQNNPNELKVLLDSLNNYANRKRDTVVNRLDSINLKKPDTTKAKTLDTTTKKTGLNN